MLGSVIVIEIFNQGIHSASVEPCLQQVMYRLESLCGTSTFSQSIDGVCTKSMVKVKDNLEAQDGDNFLANLECTLTSKLCSSRTPDNIAVVSAQKGANQ